MTGLANHTYAQLMTDLFKLLRTQWLTRPQIAKELAVVEQTAARWVAELEANGMLLARPVKHWTKPGTAPNEFTLSPEWGGKA